MQVSEEIRQDGQTQSKLAEIEERLRALEAQVQEIKSELPDNKVSIVVFSGDLDKVIASFIIATGAASMGMDVTMFFTF